MLDSRQREPQSRKIMVTGAHERKGAWPEKAPGKGFKPWD